MGRYRAKYFEAAFYDGSLVGEPDGNGGVVPKTCPEWFPAVVPEVHPENTWAGAGQVFYAGNELRIGDKDGGATINPGSYIIYKNNKLSVLDGERFQELYERVDK